MENGSVKVDRLIVPDRIIPIKSPIVIHENEDGDGLGYHHTLVRHM